MSAKSPRVAAISDGVIAANIREERDDECRASLSPRLGMSAASAVPCKRIAATDNPPRPVNIRREPARAREERTPELARAITPPHTEGVTQTPVRVEKETEPSRFRGWRGLDAWDVILHRVERSVTPGFR